MNAGWRRGRRYVLDGLLRVDLTRPLKGTQHVAIDGSGEAYPESRAGRLGAPGGVRP
jgi:hypothetical protein